MQIPYKHTKVEQTPNHNELRLMLLHSILHLQWRHHGIGLLQAYLTEPDEQTEVRVHIWHPRLIVPGIDDSGAMHDHRFKLRSHVVLGHIYHTELETIEDEDNGTWKKYTVVNARKGDTSPPMPQPGRFRMLQRPGMILCGMTYEFEKRRFHRASSDEITISIVSKIDQDERPATLIAPINTNPVHAFKQQVSKADMMAVVSEAYRELLRVRPR